MKNKKQEEAQKNEDFEKYLHDETEVSDYKYEKLINSNKKKSPKEINLAHFADSNINQPKSQILSSKKMPLAQNKTVSNNLDDPETKEENIIKSLVHDNNQENFNNKCKNCYELEKKLLKSEQKNVTLMFENKKLKDALNNAANIQQNLMHSC